VSYNNDKKGEHQPKLKVDAKIEHKYDPLRTLDTFTTDALSSTLLAAAVN
jgi:hypothetical protein